MASADFQVEFGRSYDKIFEAIFYLQKVEYSDIENFRDSSREPASSTQIGVGSPFHKTSSELRQARNNYIRIDPKIKKSTGRDASRWNFFVYLPSWKASFRSAAEA